MALAQPLLRPSHVCENSCKTGCNNQCSFVRIKLQADQVSKLQNDSCRNLLSRTCLVTTLDTADIPLAQFHKYCERIVFKIRIMVFKSYKHRSSASMVIHVLRRRMGAVKITFIFLLSALTFWRTNIKIELHSRYVFLID